MKNISINQTGTKLKIVRTEQELNPRLSDDAFYIIALASQLKKLLGPASLQHFLATGETVVFTNKATG